MPRLQETRNNADHMNTTHVTKAAAASLAAIAMLALAAPALADDVTVDAAGGANVTMTNAATGAKTTAVVHVNRASTSTPRADAGRQSAQKGIDRGDAATQKRIDDLNQIASRIAAMKLLPADAKASLAAQITAAIGDMTALKAKIDSDTATDTLKADLRSITKDYRVYLLVIPQARVMAASDRVLAVAAQMEQLSAKFGERISAAGNDAALVSAHADFDAKVSDSKAQANAAVTLVAGLKSDNGDAGVRASNTAALKAAAADIKTAQQDLKAARADADTIVKGVAGKAGASVSANAAAANQ